MDLLNYIRKSEEKIPLAKAIVHTSLLFFFGLILGVLAKLLDIWTTNLGNIFSQASVWIFLCTLISVYSWNALRAAVNVFVFCMGMLLTYYLTAEMTASIYSHSDALGWTAFALFCPLMGLIVWYAKGKSWISKILSVGILISMLVISVALFDKIRILDILFSILTAIVLFKK